MMEFAKSWTLFPARKWRRSPGCFFKLTTYMTLTARQEWVNKTEVMQATK